MKNHGTKIPMPMTSNGIWNLEVRTLIVFGEVPANHLVDTCPHRWRPMVPTKRQIAALLLSLSSKERHRMAASRGAEGREGRHLEAVGLLYEKRENGE